MPRIDQTALFREVFAAASSSAGPTAGAGGEGSLKHRRAASPLPGKRRRGADDDERVRKERAFLQEAYRIENHVRTLESLLRSVRRAYLSTATQPPRRALGSHERDRARGRQRGPDGDGADDAKDGDDEAAQLRALEGASFLSKREKDEIDLRAKIILKTCRERVGLLEAQEQARQRTAPSASPTPALSLLHTLLPSLAPASPSPSTSSPPAQLTAHRAAVLFTLTAHLARAADAQYALQEERAARRAERGRSLGAIGQAGAAGASDKLAGVQMTVPTVAVRERAAGDDDDDAADAAEANAPGDLALTPAQAQLFADENTHLLAEMQSTLSTVLAAESSILEIAQLQSSLLAQLHAQSETVDRLYDDAVRTVGDVERANKELRKAKERSGEARVFLLFFLIMGSLTLLFLDWYK